MIRKFWKHLGTEHFDRGGDLLILGTGQKGLENESDLWTLGFHPRTFLRLDHRGNR